jgi:hypothetical protein
LIAEGHIPPSSNRGYSHSILERFAGDYVAAD